MPYTTPDFLKALEKDRKTVIKELGYDYNELDKESDEEILAIAASYSMIEEIGPCRFCEEPVGKDYHLHQGFFVGHDCCWDDRLKMTE